jgi:hypothetical protein
MYTFNLLATPSQVPWRGFEPTNLSFVGRHDDHWATPPPPGQGFCDSSILHFDAILSLMFLCPHSVKLLAVRVARWYRYLHTKNPSLEIFWRALEWKNVYLMSIWHALRPLGICILWSFGIFSPFWYVVHRKIWQPCYQLVLVHKPSPIHAKGSSAWVRFGVSTSRCSGR